MENIQIRGIFALGPAPPGHAPPNTALFARLESHLLTMSRHLKDTTTRIDRLRTAMRIETSAAMRLAIREEVMKTIKEQVRARELIVKYRLKLQTLQEAEIMKVVKHMHEMGKNAQEVNNKLAHLRVTIKRETDPNKLRWHEDKIYALMKEQENARDLRERWRIRLVQMETAKIKVVKPPGILQRENVNMKNLAPKPTDKKCLSNVMANNIIKNISTPELKADTEFINNVEAKNVKKKNSTPKLKADTIYISKLVTENKSKKISAPKAKECFNDPAVKNLKKKMSTPNVEAGTKCTSEAVALKLKEKIDNRKKGKKGCKRCAILQRTNKNKNNGSKTCKVCLKWAHKVLQDGIDKVAINSEAHITADSESAMEIEPDLNADLESTIKVEIEPMAEFSMMREKVKLLDTSKSAINEEIQALDASMNDEIMSDVIKEDASDCAKTESVDFERVSSIQDELKAIDDKNTALAHIRILQEYAMINDNYRVIGLLSEVEKAFINPPKNEDFEY